MEKKEEVSVRKKIALKRQNYLLLFINILLFGYLAYVVVNSLF